MTVDSSMSDTGRSFGGYLRRQRHAGGMTLGEVSRGIHVRSQMLRLIEADDHVRLPDPLFVRSFIRAYARAVGADADHAVGLFEASRDAYLAAQQVDAAVDRFETGFGRRLAACLGAVMALAVLEIAIMQWVGIGDSHPLAATANAGRAGRYGVGTSGDMATVGYRLVILARETTWLRIALDSHPPLEYRLLTGDRLELDAHREMDLLIGNARGVTMTLNGSSVVVAGQSGQVVRLRLP